MDNKTIQCISLIGEYEDVGNLWFAVSDPKTPQRLFDYFMNNVEKDGQIVSVKFEDVPIADFEREE